VTDLADRREPDPVYQPAEDSRLLGATVESFVDRDDLVLDVGTGSGWVGSVAADEGATVVGVDVNPHACRAARDRGVPTVRGNLVDPFQDRTFDVVAFNPPYLPTDPDDERDDWQERALSGGESGRAVIDPFLDTVGRVLTPGGEVFLLVSSLTDIEEVTARAEANGFTAEEVASEKFPFERLVVLRIITVEHQTD